MIYLVVDDVRLQIDIRWLNVNRLLVFIPANFSAGARSHFQVKMGNCANLFLSLSQVLKEKSPASFLPFRQNFFSFFPFRAKIEMRTALITLRQNILIHLPFILLNCVTELFTRCRTKFPSIFPKSGSRSVSHFGMNCRTWLCPYRAVHLLVFLAHKVIFTGELKDKSSVLSEKAEQHLISHS